MYVNFSVELAESKIILLMLSWVKTLEFNLKILINILNYPKLLKMTLHTFLYKKLIQQLDNPKWIKKPIIVPFLKFKN